MHNVFYFTDIHGQYNLYTSIMDDCLEIDPECMIIFGGDACDRGIAGYKIMRELLDNPQVVYLKGNHEDLFVKAAHEIIGFCAANDDIYNKFKSKNKEFAQNICLNCDKRIMPNLSLHLYNGGVQTIQDWIMDGADEDFIDRIENLPLTFSYENIDFCHAGATYEYFKNASDAEYHRKPVDTESEKRLLWDRNLLPLGWETGRICVFGHTPTISLPTGIYGRDQSTKHAKPCAWQDKMSAKDKRGGWKIDMDTAAVWSNRAFVLNCLTMMVYGFEKEVFENGCIIKNLDIYKIIQ